MRAAIGYRIYWDAHDLRPTISHRDVVTISHGYSVDERINEKQMGKDDSQ